jgi:diketogulonate reductase-like aldo/keto reductase
MPTRWIACASVSFVFAFVDLGASASTVLIPQIELLGGINVPALGLGVYMVSPGEETYNTVKTALDLGYRMVDTAQMYRNEADVGRAIADSGIPREQLWIQSKLDTGNHGYDKTLATVTDSIEKMGLSYLDCYLIHSPFGEKIVETYDALLKLKSDGKLRTVGVSNFDVRHIEPLRELGRPLPVLNQIEMHPAILPERKDVVNYCAKHGIVVQAYGSLFFGQERLLHHENVKTTVARTGKTAAQVLLRWAYQLGFQLIPKSVKKHRQDENMNIFDFELSAEDMQLLSDIKGELNAYWNPLKDAAVDLGDVSKHAEL